MRAVVTIGDALFDAVEIAGRPPVLYAGGAGLNLAIGLRKLGLPSLLAARVGHDRLGYRLRRHLRDNGVRLLETPNADFTSIVTSTRANGEPSYFFSASTFRRRIHFGPPLIEAIAAAPAVAVNSFPFANDAQARTLVAAFARSTGITVLDPNPRPRLISDIDAFRAGVEKAASAVRLVKLSEEDVAILYGGSVEKVIERFLALGAKAVVLTRGAAGASVFPAAGTVVDVPASVLRTPVVDTMGAGDAALASIVTSLVRLGTPTDAGAWRKVLSRAMEVAATTCRSSGGETMLPADLQDA